MPEKGWDEHQQYLEFHPSGYSCAERAEKGWQAEQCADAVHGGEETGRGAV